MDNKPTALVMLLCGLSATQGCCSTDIYSLFFRRGRQAPTRPQSALGHRADNCRGSCLQLTGGPKAAALYTAAGVGYGMSVALVHTPAAPFVMAAAMKAHAAAIGACAVSSGTTMLYVKSQAEATQEILDAARAERAGLQPRSDRPSVAEVQRRHLASSSVLSLPVHRDGLAVADGAENAQRFKASMPSLGFNCWRKRASDEELEQSLHDGNLVMHQLTTQIGITEQKLNKAENEDDRQQYDELVASNEDLQNELTRVQNELINRRAPSTVLARTELAQVAGTCRWGQNLWCGYEQGHDPTGVSDCKARNIVKMLPLSKSRVVGACSAHLPMGPRELVAAYFKTAAGQAFASVHPLLVAACIYGPAPGGWGMAIQPFTTWAGYEIGEQLAKAVDWWGEKCVENNGSCIPSRWRKPATEFMLWRHHYIHDPTIISKETFDKAEVNIAAAAPGFVDAVKDAIKAFSCQNAGCDNRGECWCLEKLQSDLGMTFPTLPYSYGPRTSPQIRTDMTDLRMRGNDNHSRHQRAMLLREAILQHIMANEHKLGQQVKYTSEMHGDWINIPKLGALVPKSSVYYTDEKNVQQYARVLNNEGGDYYRDHKNTIRLECFALPRENRIIEIDAEAPCATDDVGLVRRTIWEHNTCDHLMQSPHHNFHNLHYMELWATQYAALSAAIKALGLPVMEPRPSTGGHH